MTENTRLLEMLVAAKKAEADAESAYSGVASFGVLSIWFKDREEKLKAQQLRLDYQKTKQSRESVETELRAAKARVLKLLELFLRGCLRSSCSCKPVQH